MSSDVREIEWRFDAVDLRPLLRWLERREGPEETQRVEVVAIGNGVTEVDSYFETDDWRFRRSGCALRIRRLGRRREAEAALERLDAPSRDLQGSRDRREVSERLPAADPAT